MKKYILAFIIATLMAFLIGVGSFTFVVCMMYKAIEQSSVSTVQISTRAYGACEPLEPLPEMTCVEPMLYYNVPLDEDLQSYIFELCEASGIDSSIVIAMIGRESTYRDYVVGDNGRSFGLMQIQARWHRDRMSELGCTDLLDPYQNVAVGVDYLAELMSTGEPIEWVLMAYNGGPSYANKKYLAGIVSDYAREILVKSENLSVK